MHLVVMVINAQHVLSTALRQENSMANTRLHSAAAASNWSCSTTLNWSSFETLGSNKYNTLGKELILWKNTHHMCIYMYIYIFPPTEGIPISVFALFFSCLRGRSSLVSQKAPGRCVANWGAPSVPWQTHPNWENSENV